MPPVVPITDSKASGDAKAVAGEPHVVAERGEVSLAEPESRQSGCELVYDREHESLSLLRAQPPERGLDAGRESAPGRFRPGRRLGGHSRQEAPAASVTSPVVGEHAPGDAEQPGAFGPRALELVESAPGDGEDL